MKKSNYIYIYQNDFTSLITLLVELAKSKILPLNIQDKNYIPGLFDKVIELDLSSSNTSAIISHIDRNILNTLFYLYLSNHEYKELIMYYFFLYSLKFKEKVIFHRDINIVDEALKIVKYVQNENHKLKGFTRFKELKRHILYAEITCENNVIFLLSNHFKRRLKNEFWIIKDVKRNILSIYDKKDLYLVDANNCNLKEIILSEEEQEIEDLWKSFYKTIGIKERQNDRCHLNFMPKKYWKYILEVSDEI